MSFIPSGQRKVYYSQVPVNFILQSKVPEKVFQSNVPDKVSKAKVLGKYVIPKHQGKLVITGIGILPYVP